MRATVLKSSGSAFENFVRDEFTTLVEVNDRIFSTSIDLKYVFDPIPVSLSLFEAPLPGTPGGPNAIFAAGRFPEVYNSGFRLWIAS